MESGARIFVAGHAGMIGSAVVRRLGREDCEVIVRPRGRLDLTDGPAVGEFFTTERPDYVILAAGRGGGIVANRTYPADFMRENLEVQLNVLRAAHESGCKRLVFFGSSCMYPRVCEQPMSEDALLTGVPESTSLAYAMAKLAGVQQCLAYNQQYGGLRFVPVIPNSVYGPGDNFDLAGGHVLSVLIRRFHEAKLAGRPEVVLWGSGAPRREFVYADDLAEACWVLLKLPSDGVALPANIGVGEDISIAALAGLIAKIVGFDGRVAWDASKPDGAPRKLLDSSRVRGLGWRPATGLEAGLRKTYAWYLQNIARLEPVA